MYFVPADAPFMDVQARDVWHVFQRPRPPVRLLREGEQRAINLIEVEREEKREWRREQKRRRERARREAMAERRREAQEWLDGDERRWWHFSAVWKHATPLREGERVHMWCTAETEAFALARLRADDPLWTRDGVQFEGEGKPDVDQLVRYNRRDSKTQFRWGMIAKVVR